MAATATGEGEATRQKRKKKPKPNHEDLGVAPSQSHQASKPLPSAPSLQTPTQSAALGIPTLEEAAAEAEMRKRKKRKEQKLEVLPLAQNPTLEEGGEGVDSVLATAKKKKHKERKPSPSPSAAAAAAETPILELEAKVTKKRKPRKEQEPPGNSPLPVDPGQTQPRGTKAPHVSKLLPAAPFLEVPAQSSAPGTSMLEEAAAGEAAMRKRKVHKEQKVVALSLAQNPTLEEPAEERVPATTKKKKHKERKKLSLSPSATAAAETPVLEQYAKVTRKRKRSKKQEPSGYSALPLDPGQTQLHGTNAPGTPMLEGEAAEVMRKRKIRKEQKVTALSLAENTTLEERREDAMTAKMQESKHMEHTLSCPSTSVTSKTTIWEQEAKVNKKPKQRKQQGPSGESPLPLDPGQTQPQETHAPPLPVVPFLEAPAQSPAPEILTLEEAAAAVMRKKKICKEQKVAALSLAQNTTLEEQREDAMMTKNKESKHMKHTLSCPSTSVASKTTIWEQEGNVNKKQNQRKQRQSPSGESPLPLDPGKIQPQGTHAPPLPAIPFLEAPAQSPAPEIPTLEEAVAAVMRRKICKEQKVVALSLAQNTTLEEQREDVMMAKNKESKHMKHTISSPTSVAAKTTIWEQEVKVTEKQKQMKQEQPSGKSALPLNPGQAHCVQPQGSKAPLEQEQEADGRMGSSIKKNNGKRPRVHFLSKRELIKEAGKKQQALPEGFVAFSDFVSSCTEQNPDHPSVYSAFFDQFRYNPVRGDRKPPLPRTPDRLARLPPRKSKKKDSGSGSIPGSQDKLHAKEKINPKNKMKAKKPLLTRAEKSSDKYRRVPLDQLVPPPRSPHNLLQEKYASDPWKVIVICMLLNLTQGKQVKNIIEGFFECYPDPQSACITDPDKMAGYLACLGLQRVKTLRIQRFSKEYVEKEWTYITELCGVGK